MAEENKGEQNVDYKQEYEKMVAKNSVLVQINDTLRRALSEIIVEIMY